MKKLISHVGIAVADLEKSIQTWRLITGNDPSHTGEVSDQKVKVAMFQPAENSEASRIELVAPTSESSPIARFIDQRGEGLHHICIYVDDLESKLEALKNEGVKLIDKTPRIGAEGNKIAFVHPASTGNVLIELEEIS